MKEKPEDIDHKLFKIQPVLDHVRNNCILVEPERQDSTDQQIMPAKAKYSLIRQQNPKKTKNGVLKILLGLDHQIFNVQLFSIQW